MVSAHSRRWDRAWFAAGMLLLCSATQAAVTARVDRNTIDLNESFTLEIVVDTEIDLQPDVAALNDDFYVGQSSQLSNTMIINGEISRSRTWSYQLMAKRTGELVIPPVSVGAESSEPLRINVRQPANAPPGEADVFITGEVDFSESYVQAQVLYRIKVYRAVPTRQPALRDPEFGGAEVLIEVAGSERSYDALLNGRTYNVVERVYAIFPQESGEVTISPARFEARILRDGRITGRKVFESEAQTIRVLPIPGAAGRLPERHVAAGEGPAARGQLVAATGRPEGGRADHPGHHDQGARPAGNADTGDRAADRRRCQRLSGPPRTQPGTRAGRHSRHSQGPVRDHRRRGRPHDVAAAAPALVGRRGG